MPSTNATVSLRSRKRTLVFILALQFVFVGVWMPTHRDTDYSVWPGQTKILEHKDSGPCRDIPLSQDDYCAICAAAQSRVSFTPVHFTVGEPREIGLVDVLAPVTPSQQLHLDSFTRRGPPPLLFV
jgi:hypothetical protein